MIVLPPPESTANQSPEAFVALITLVVIGFVVYGISKFKLLNLVKFVVMALSLKLPRLFFKWRRIT